MKNAKVSTTPEDDKKKISDHNEKRFLYALVLVLKNIILMPVRFIVSISSHISKLFRFSLTYRIGLVYTLLSMVVLIVFNIGLISSFRYLWFNSEIQIIEKAKVTYSESFQHYSDIKTVVFDSLTRSNGIELNMYDNNQNLVYTSNPKLPHLTYNIKSGVTTNLKIKGERFIISSQIKKINGEAYYIQVVKNVTDNANNLNRLTYIGTILTLILSIAIIYIGAKISKLLLNPITNMTDQIKTITIKRLDIRLDSEDVQDELKDLTLQFNSLLDNIEDAYRKQNQFVSDASHELRTPISVINGYVGMLDRWGKKDEAILDESIQAIKGETIQMKELIEKLLFLARSDRNKIEMEIEQLAMHELIAEICRETKMIDTYHQIECDISGESTILGNEKLIKQMMRIFIENAIKFTEEDGTITIGMHIVKDQTLLYVKDTGIGIAKQDLPKVFDRFYRTDKSRTKKSGGTGLGLSIAKWIIDQHQATVKIYSEVGIGTKIEIWFNKKMKLVSEEEVAKLDR